MILLQAERTGTLIGCGIETTVKLCQIVNYIFVLECFDIIGDTDADVIMRNTSYST